MPDEIRKKLSIEIDTERLKREFRRISNLGQYTQDEKNAYRRYLREREQELRHSEGRIRQIQLDSFTRFVRQRRIIERNEDRLRQQSSQTAASMGFAWRTAYYDPEALRGYRRGFGGGGGPISPGGPAPLGGPPGPPPSGYFGRTAGPAGGDGGGGGVAGFALGGASAMMRHPVVSIGLAALGILGAKGFKESMQIADDMNENFRIMARGLKVTSGELTDFQFEVSQTGRAYNFSGQEMMKAGRIFQETARINDERLIPSLQGVARFAFATRMSLEDSSETLGELARIGATGGGLYRFTARLQAASDVLGKNVPTHEVARGLHAAMMMQAGRNPFDLSAQADRTLAIQTMISKNAMALGIPGFVGELGTTRLTNAAEQTAGIRNPAALSIMYQAMGGGDFFDFMERLRSGDQENVVKLMQYLKSQNLSPKLAGYIASEGMGIFQTPSNARGFFEVANLGNQKAISAYLATHGGASDETMGKPGLGQGLGLQNLGKQNDALDDSIDKLKTQSGDWATLGDSTKDLNQKFVELGTWVGESVTEVKRFTNAMANLTWEFLAAVDRFRDEALDIHPSPSRSRIDRKDTNVVGTRGGKK